MTPHDSNTVAGPEWTRGRLVSMLSDCFGETSSGAVDIAAVARGMAVTERTVQRWIAGADTAPAVIPAVRLRQLRTGGPSVEKHAAAKATYARNAIRAIALPKGRGILPPWERDGWLKQHVVLVLATYSGPWRQLVATNGGDRAVTEIRRRGEILDLTTVTTKFHADLLVHDVMTRLAPWQVQARPLRKGRGQAWSDDAPDIDLSVIAVELGLRT